MKKKPQEWIPKDTPPGTFKKLFEESRKRKEAYKYVNVIPPEHLKMKIDL